jgi:hypothetical protein
MRAPAILQRLILGLIAAVVLVYAGDYLWAKHLMSSPGSAAALGTVMVHHQWDVPRKDGRVEFDMEAPEAETCIHSLFPHFGYVTCWYAARHTTIQN